MHVQVRKRVEAKGAEEAFAVKGKVYVTFMDNPGSMPDPAPDAPEPDDKHNPKNIPGRCGALLGSCCASVCTQQQACKQCVHGRALLEP